jgi:excisionase family DNA binding protein
VVSTVETPEVAEEDMVLLSIKDVAALYSISARGVYRLVEDGRLQHVRIGRSIRLRPVDVARFIEDNLVTETKEKTPAAWTCEGQMEFE